MKNIQDLILKKVSMGVCSCQAVEDSLTDLPEEIGDYFLAWYRSHARTRLFTQGFKEISPEVWDKLSLDEIIDIRRQRLTSWFSALEQAKSALDASIDQRDHDSAVQVPLLTPQEHQNDDANSAISVSPHQLWKHQENGHRVREPNPLSKRCYLMSESHLSGFRLIIGFENLNDVGEAHAFVSRIL